VNESSCSFIKTQLSFLSRAIVNPVLSGFTLSVALLLSACGGGGGGDSGGSKPPNLISNGNNTWQMGVYKPSPSFESKCENPRVGVSKITGIPFPDRKGSATDEKNFLRSWSYETYLWFEDLSDLNPASGDTPQAYFNRLVSNKRTASGSYKDNFHFYEPTEDEEAWREGISYGYGLNLKINWDTPRSVQVAYTVSGSPAAEKNIQRGAKILAVDGVSISSIDINALYDALYPSQINAVHEFEIQDVGANTTRKVTLESTSMSAEAVSVVKAIDQNETKVGYVQFNSFIFDAQDQWVTAMHSLRNAGVSDLVVDMRYNGGGSVVVAAQVGYMIAGSHSANKVFYQSVANSKMPRETPLKFVDEGLYGLNKARQLPSLNLQRVYVLSTGSTCSASEMVINGLRGIGVEVFLIGDTTCGKPYAFNPQPNCGTTYYTIQFQVVNAKGFGEYGDGFIPSASDNGLDRIKGCKMADNLIYQLGDPNEPLLAAALHLRATGSCPATSAKGLQKLSVAEEGEFIQPETRKLLILTP
jgi:carboxyl-terminal processing protease